MFFLDKKKQADFIRLLKAFLLHWRINIYFTRGGAISYCCSATHLVKEFSAVVRQEFFLASRFCRVFFAQVIPLQNCAERKDGEV